MKRITALTLTGLMALSAAAAPVMAESATEGIADAQDSSVLLTLSAQAGTLDSTVLQMLQGTKLRMLFTLAAGGDALGMDINALVCDESILRFLGNISQPDSAISFSFPDVSESLYRATVEVQENGQATLEGFDEIFGGSDSMSTYSLDPELAADTLLPYLELLGDTITDQSESVTGEISLPYLGMKADGETYTWAPDGDDAAELLNKIADQIETDENIQKLADELADYYQNGLDLMEEQNGATTVAASLTEAETEAAPPAITHFSTDPSSYDPESLQAMIDYLHDFRANAPSDLREFATELPEAIPEGMLNTQVSITDEKVCRILLSVNNPSNDASISADYEYLNQALSLYVEDASSYEPQSLQFACVRKDDGDLRAGKYQVRMNGERLAQGSYSFDLSQRSLLGAPYGELTLSTPVIDDAELTLGVRAGAQGGDDHYLTVGGIRPYINEAIVDDVTITLNSISSEESAEPPSGSVIDLGKLDQEELNSVLSDLGDRIASHAENVWNRISQKFH